MHKLVSFVVLVMVNSFFVQASAKDLLVSSPDGAVTVTVGVKANQPYYSVDYRQHTIVSPSRLGFDLSDGLLGSNMKMLGHRFASKDETWSQPWGEEDSVRNHYKELTVRFVERSAARREMSVVFRVFNDGFGFRYILPRKKGEKYCIQDELTEFTLAHDAKAWSIPTNRTAYFEGIYTQDLLSRKDTVCTPLTIEYEDNLYLTIHEAALEDYASLNITPLSSPEGDTALHLRAALTPWQNGVKVYCEGETKTPWRTMIIGRTAGELMTSRLMLNLNEPSRIDDTSWIEPGRYIGIWWSIHKKLNTWEMGPTHGATTQNVKRYIEPGRKQLLFNNEKNIF